MKKYQKGFAPILIVLILAVAVVGYLAYQNYQLKNELSVVNNPNPSASTESLAIPTSTPTPRTAVNPSASPVNTIMINYLFRPTWQTHTDSVGKFSLQYDTNPSGEFKYHLALGETKPGQLVRIMNCNTPTSGPAAGQEICQSGYTLEIFNTYTGGSRREWFAKTFNGYGPTCQVYYQDVAIAGKNGLLATSDCSSWGETSILIPNGNQMVVYEFTGYSRDNKTGKITLSQFAKDALTTFKYTN